MAEALIEIRTNAKTNLDAIRTGADRSPEMSTATAFEAQLGELIIAERREAEASRIVADLRGRLAPLLAEAKTDAAVAAKLSLAARNEIANR